MQSMSHPNIVRFVEYSLEPRGDAEYLMLVTELCAGGDLQKRVAKAKLREGGRSPAYFAEDQIWSWFIQLACAVKHAHDRKILHRDIKTANIFLGHHPGSSQEVVKLGDFGISRVLQGTGDLARTNVGTPYYMSPELCDQKCLLLITPWQQLGPPPPPPGSCPHFVISTVELSVPSHVTARLQGL